MAGNLETRGRPHEGTPDNKAAYLQALSRQPFFYMAAEACGFGERTVRRWRKEDPEFDADCKDIYERSREYVEATLLREATVGYTEHYFYKGQIIRDANGNAYTKKVISIAAAKLFLRGRHPEIYNTKMIDATLRPGERRIRKEGADVTEAQAMQAYLEMIRD